MAKDIKTAQTQKGTVKTFKGTIKTLEHTMRSGQNIKAAYNQADASNAPDNAPANVFQYGTEYTAEKYLPRIIGKTASITHSSAVSAVQVKNKVSIAKESIKQIQPNVKVAKASFSNGFKSVQNTAKAAQNSIKATNTAAKTSATVKKSSAQTLKVTYEGAKATAQATAEATKVAAKATVETIKAIAVAVKAGAEALGSLIAAGGWIAVAVIVLIVILLAVICAVLSSPHGIFLSGENIDNSITMPMAISSINTEYSNQLNDIINNTPHDVVEMSGSRAVWSEVLSIYAVKTIRDGAQEIVTVDEEKQELLSKIFWEMNKISFRSETKDEVQIIETDDGQGNIIEQETSVTLNYLYITVSHKTADEMADIYHFSAEERAELLELLSPLNKDLWSQALYGISEGNDDIASIAMSQIGNIGGEPYWRWYGFNSRVDWCACFVSWCANECGYIDVGIIPKFASCSYGVNWFKSRELWQDKSYEPRAGDIIFFDWIGDNGQDGRPDHVGIVTKVDNGKIYTVEGNASDACKEKTYPIGYKEIFGYGVPAY